MIISAYIVVFMIAAAVGWLFESIYGILRLGRWDRRGFLFGPLCPIYGVGVVAGLLAFNRPEVASGVVPVWAVFLASMAGSALLEYSVSLSMERLFGAVWWDYSDLPLNLNGRICLPASLLFGVGGVLVAYFVAPLFNTAYAQVPPVAFEVLALVFVGMLASDTTATLISLSDLMLKIMQMDEAVNTYADDKVQLLHEAVQQTSQGVKSSVGKAVDQTKGVGLLVLDRMESARDATTMKAERMASLPKAKIDDVAARLTLRERHLLRHIRRFGSEDLRNKAAALRLRLSERAASLAGRGEDDA